MNNKQLQIVSFEQAKRLKAAGFDWPVDTGYNAFGRIFSSNEFDHNSNSIAPLDYSAPTVALALKWFRDVKGMLFDVLYVRHNYSPTKVHGWRGEYRIDNKTGATTLDFETYEAAESALLDELLTLIEKEK